MCSRELQREPSQDRQVGMEPDALKAADAKEREAIVVLQATELALDGGAATVQAASLVAVTGDGAKRPREQRKRARPDDRHPNSPFGDGPTAFRQSLLCPSEFPNRKKTRS